MLTFSHIVGGVLTYCGFPVERILPRGIVCEYGLDKIRFYMTELNLTDENWLLARRDLTVNPNTSEYSLGLFPSFGRPVVVETKDAADLNHVRREIPVIDFQDRKLLYDGPAQGDLGYDSSMHNARSMSAYSRDGEKRIAIDPMPSQTATYTVYYEPDSAVPQTLEDSAFPLEQFGGLLKAAIAKPCLAHCEYEEAKYERLLTAIDAELAEYTRQFQKYIRQDVQPKSAHARGFMTGEWIDWGY